MNTNHIVVIDDDLLSQKFMEFTLRDTYDVQSFGCAEKAFDVIKKSPPDLVLLDIGLPGMNGVDALKILRENYPELMIIMITGVKDASVAVSAMKLGAYDYLVKPIPKKSLQHIVKTVFDTIRMKKDVQILQDKYLKENLPAFIAESDSIQDIIKIVKKISRSLDTPVMIVGETGTGKELIAQAIHYRSPNFSGPLVSVNCAAIPSELIESELFGYEKGAFTGADRSGKKGFVEAADNGTLFLDEVGDLSNAAQAKLLRFLEEGTFYRIGSTTARQVKTRIISATNHNLMEMCKKGAFRKDLYYRLAVIKIELPSLNQRRNDIIPIAQQFLIEFGKKFGKKFTGIDENASRLLKAYDWQGNIRELKNTIERAVLLADGPVLTAENLFMHDGAAINLHQAREEFLPGLSEKGLDLPSIIETIERDYIQQALDLTSGNESRAAQLLGMTRDAFRYRKSKFKLTPEPKPPKP